MSDRRIIELLDESIAVVQRWHEQHPNGKREAFDRIQLMHSQKFAEVEARKLRDVVAANGKVPEARLIQQSTLRSSKSR